MFTLAYFVLAFFAGMTLPLAMAPFNWHGLAFLSVLFFIDAAHRYAKHRAILTGVGFVYGFGVYALGIYWLYISIHTYGGVSVFLAFSMVALMVVFMAALFFMPLAWLTGWVLSHQPRRLVFALFFPSLWVLFELAKTYLLGGFPWLLLGYSQMGWPLAGIASIWGVYGVSWLSVLTAVALYDWVVVHRLHSRMLCMAVPLLWLSMAALPTVHWTSPIGHRKTVNMVQANVSLYDKWHIERLPLILDKYSHMLSSAKAADLNIFPEGSLPTTRPDWVRSWLYEQEQAAKMHHSYTLVGAMLDNGPYNGALLLGPSHGVYVKQHLVQFGEYIPLRALLDPIGHWLNIPMSHLKSMHARVQTLSLGGVLLTPAICYEIAYPIEFAHRVAQSHGHVLVAISEDAWFGHSIEPFQHLQIAQMRALETGRELLFATNQGVSAVVNARGQVVHRSALQQASILHVTVQPYTGTTPWVAWGHYCLVWLILGLMLLALLIHHRGLRHWGCAWFTKERR